MERNPDSHKGENGIVAIVGGSATMHGAPLFSALAAEASGVDLVHVMLPRCHADAAKAMSLNFQVRLFAGDELAAQDTEAVLECLASVDCAVLGPGIAHGNAASIRALEAIIEGAACPLVLDAAALQPTTLSLVQGKTAVLTPHLGELERMEVRPELIGEVATQNNVTLFLKGPTDRLALPDDEILSIKGGNAGLTVGGTGDALAGLIAGLIGQGMPPGKACLLAGELMKKAAEELFADLWFAYRTQDVIARIPHLLCRTFDTHHV
ncbi:MAG: NAD(P)H-hydrate dehydratase [Candidatus Peribacteraceae bacterium]|nr:NAD(P)H-hydrate dehydratase [Candidatus Peribacteraceae bacterium]